MKKIPVRKIAASHTLQNIAGKFSIRNLQTVLNGHDLVHDLHRHDFYFILAIKHGKGMHEIDFISYPVHDHTIFILRPGQVHRLELDAGTTGFLTEFDQSYYQPKQSISEQRWKKATSKNVCEVETAAFDKLFLPLEAAFREYTDKEDGFQEAIRSHLDIFFIEFNRQSRNNQNIYKTDNTYTLERFEELCRLLDANIVNMKSVQQYADLMNLSTYQLNSISKSSVGKTVSDLINEQIILEAKRQVLATSSQVKDIAGHLGYEDVSYFIRFFKKQTGQTPDAFRKNFK